MTDYKSFRSQYIDALEDARYDRDGDLVSGTHTAADKQKERDNIEYDMGYNRAQLEQKIAMLKRDLMQRKKDLDHYKGDRRVCFSSCYQVYTDVVRREREVAYFEQLKADLFG